MANHRVSVYDVTGRCLGTKEAPGDLCVFEISASGIYFVQVGNAPAQKVAVVR